VSPPHSFTSLSSPGEVNLVTSSPLTRKWTTGVIEKMPAVNGTPADRSRCVKPFSK
jgi:hypothetical protein